MRKAFARKWAEDYRIARKLVFWTRLNHFGYLWTLFMLSVFSAVSAAHEQYINQIVGIIGFLALRKFSSRFPIRSKHNPASYLRQRQFWLEQADRA